MEVVRAPGVTLKTGRFERGNGRREKYTLADELPDKLSELRLRERDERERGERERERECDKRAFTVRRLTADDDEAALCFLTKYFFRDEPMNVAVKLLESPQSRCAPLEEYALGSLAEGVSLAAVDDRGALVGLIINGVADKNSPVDMEDKVSSCPDPKFSRVLRVLAHLDEAADVWGQAGCSRVLEVRIASTAEEWRGKGLMKALCDETEKLARQLECGALRVDTTSAYSAAAVERLGYRQIYTVAYRDLPGAPLPEPPHTNASVYVKNI